MDPYYADVIEIGLRITRNSGRHRRSLLRNVKAILQSAPHCETERVRVGTVKTLISLLPDSDPIIRGIVRETRNARLAELQFTVFCFLDRVPDVAGEAPLRKDIPELVQKYLMNVRFEAASAAWMAGDLLGDHWNLASSLTRLIRVAREGKYVAGRKGALHGLEMALYRCRRGTADRIRRVLKEVAERDPSASVRAMAVMTLRFLGWRQRVP